MNGVEEFKNCFPQYLGVQFVLKGKEYYMHMNCPTKGCAIDRKNESGEWDREVYKFSNLDEMTNAKLFDGKSFMELIENTDNFEEIFY